MINKQERGESQLDAITLNRVSFTYGKIENVIQNVEVSIQQNEFTAIIGDNGSGKTTLGKIMAGILKPSSGNTFIFDKNSREMTLGEIGTRIGYLFQNPEKQLFAASVEAEIGFALELKGYTKEQIKSIVDHMLDLFQLKDVRHSFPFYLSQGEKQRLALAAILADSPRYLILDEPTTGLDVQRKKYYQEYWKD
ncbi:MAG: energy-coupling factor ABC transporter ATP-binding protein [Bacillota bacterium]